MAVAGNRLFVVSDESLHALDTETGKSVWTTESVARPSVLIGGIQVAEETVFVFGGMFLSAFDAATGKQTVAVHDRPRNRECPRNLRRCRLRRKRRHYVYALDAETGRRRWRYKTDGRVSCDIAFAAGVVYAGSEDGHLYALDAKTGTKRWKRHAGNVEVIAVDGGHVYAGLDSR